MHLFKAGRSYWTKGDSLIGIGVRDGELAVVDRGLEPRPRDVVMVDVDGERALKVWEVAADGGVVLGSANPRHPSAPVAEGAVVEVWAIAVLGSATAPGRRIVRRAAVGWRHGARDRAGWADQPSSF